MRARSTAASVWPARTSTPPSRARSGNMCPGRARSAGFVAGSMAASTVAARSAAEMPVLVRCLRLDRHAERRLEPRGVLRHHQRDLELVEALAGHRQADQAAAVPRHEVDDLRRDLLDAAIVRSPFVLAVLVVDDDDHPAGADGLDGVLDRRERRAPAVRRGPSRPDARALGCRLMAARAAARPPSGHRPASCATRTTYLPMMSTSRLTPSPGRLRLQVGVLPGERDDLHVELGLAAASRRSG